MSNAPVAIVPRPKMPRILARWRGENRSESEFGVTRTLYLLCELLHPKVIQSGRLPKAAQRAGRVTTRSGRSRHFGFLNLSRNWSVWFLIDGSNTLFV